MRLRVKKMSSAVIYSAAQWQWQTLVILSLYVTFHEQDILTLRFTFSSFLYKCYLAEEQDSSLQANTAVLVKVLSGMHMTSVLFISTEGSGMPTLINKCGCKHKFNSFSKNEAPYGPLWRHFCLIKLLDVCFSTKDYHRTETQLFILCSCPEEGCLSNFKCHLAWHEWLHSVWPHKVITIHLSDSLDKLTNLKN